MHKVGVRELKQNASAVLRRVKAGEVLEVTERGQPVARLIPLKLSRIEQLIAEGKMTPADMTLEEVRRKFPLREPSPGQKPLSQIVIEMREEERY